MSRKQSRWRNTHSVIQHKLIRILLLSTLMVTTVGAIVPAHLSAQEGGNQVFLPFTSSSIDTSDSGQGPVEFDVDNPPALPADAVASTVEEGDNSEVSALALDAGCIGWPTTRYGDSGYWVYWAQHFLKNYHARGIAHDSSFGPATYGAVRYVQQYWKDRGYRACGRTIDVDGIIGPQGWALLYYMRTPPQGGTIVDNDGDGISDAKEDRLLKKFAPRIWLHRDEAYKPSTPEWFMQQSRLRFNHNNCYDHNVIERGNVNANNIANQSHQGNDRWCRHNSSNIHYSNSSTSFFLDLENSRQGTVLAQSQWKLYGHVYKYGHNGDIMIQYWQFYAYNASGASSLRINHEGDWEYTAVIIDSAEQVKEVQFRQHGHEFIYQKNQIEWVDGTHHVTFAAKGSHANYKNKGFSQNCDYTGPLSVLDICGAGIAWDSWRSNFGGIVNLGETGRTLNNSNWIHYAGLWGEIGDFPDGHTTGPTGPAQKYYWQTNMTR